MFNVRYFFSLNQSTMRQRVESPTNVYDLHLVVTAIVDNHQKVWSDLADILCDDEEREKDELTIRINVLRAHYILLSCRRYTLTHYIVHAHTPDRLCTRNKTN